MKTKEELNALKNEIKALNEKLAELTEDELGQVLGGSGIDRRPSISDDGSESIDWETVIEK